MIKSRLRVLLAERNMTQRQLAEKTGIRPPTISALCNNTLKRIPFEVIDKICSALDCEPSDLLSRE